jgi:hypothetical protein
MNLVLPRGARGLYQFDLVRLAGERPIGGVTYQIRTR